MRGGGRAEASMVVRSRSRCFAARPLAVLITYGVYSQEAQELIPFFTSSTPRLLPGIGRPRTRLDLWRLSNSIYGDAYLSCMGSIMLYLFSPPNDFHCDAFSVRLLRALCLDLGIKRRAEAHDSIVLRNSLLCLVLSIRPHEYVIKDGAASLQKARPLI